MRERSVAIVSTRSGCAADSRRACWPDPTRRACAGAWISSAPTSSATFRNSAGAEIDLLLKLPGHRHPWAIEIKRGLAPKIERGFHLACESVRPERRLVVYGGVERFPLADGVEAVSLGNLCGELPAA